MDTDMGWRDAIAEVLKTSDTPLHYSDIAQAIIDRGYRQNVGATPAATVAAVLSMSLNKTASRPPSCGSHARCTPCGVALPRPLLGRRLTTSPTRRPKQPGQLFRPGGCLPALRWQPRHLRGTCD